MGLGFHTLRFEADEGAFGGDWSADSQPPPQREMPNGWDDQPAGQQPAAGEELDPQVPSGIDYNSPEFLEAVNAATEHNISRLLEQAAQYDPEADDVDPDELIDPQVLQFIDQRFQRAIDQRFGQIAPTVEAFEDRENIAQVEQWCEAEPAIAEAQQILGEGDDAPSAASLVQFAATGYLHDLEERYGPGERATRTAIRMAADQVRAGLKAAHDAGYQARNAELQGHVRTPQRVPAGPAEAVRLEDQPADEMEAMERIMARRNGH